MSAAKSAIWRRAVQETLTVRKNVQFSKSGDCIASHASRARLLLANVHEVDSNDKFEMYDDMTDSCKACEVDIGSICEYSHAAECREVNVF